MEPENLNMSLEYKYYEELTDEILDMVYPLYQNIFQDSYDLSVLKERSQNKNHYLSLIVFDGSNPVAMKLGFEEEGYFHSWIGGVLKNYRNQGIATSLTEKQHAWAKAKGFTQVKTHTNHKFNNMLIHNIRNGFEIVDIKIRPQDGIKKFMPDIVHSRKPKINKYFPYMLKYFSYA